VYGVVEGFYGKPYTQEMRRILIRALSGPGGPAYLYAPKDDPHHRIRWREPYPAGEWEQLAAAVREAGEAGVDFWFGLSPWGFSGNDHGAARKVLERAASAGAAGLCLLFDDIPSKASGGLAETQLEFARNAVDGIGLPVMACPTVYCMEFTRDNPGALEYLEVWRRTADPDWMVLWTGPGVVSRELSGLEEARALLGRPPVIWDNLLADDYCLRRVYLSTLAGRAAPGTPWLLNPSRIFPVALHGVMELRAAATGRTEWPGELGPRTPGWNLLRCFHYTPWEPSPEGAAILEDLAGALRGRGVEKCLAWLDRAVQDMEEFCGALAGIPGGWDLHPVAADTARSLSIWRRALRADGPSSRRALLHYLMHERLPYENPLAGSAANPPEETP
jgi:hypothetical protein